MIDADSQLPPAFADLERFVPLWSEESSTDARYAARGRASIEELRIFYTAITPRLDAIFDHLDRIPCDEELPAAEERLYRLTLAAAEAASAVELFNQPDVPFRTPEHFIRAKWSDEA
jgi:hypothetical protein